MSAAHASHPLTTEDTGVQGKGGWEIELHGDRAREGERRTTQAAATLAYGIAAKADLELELPRHGDAAASLKWRFYEREKLSLAFKPDLLGRGRWAANLAAAYDAGRVELLGHAGYTHNRNRIGERRSLRHASAALLFAATEELKRDVDLGIGIKRGRRDPADDRTLLAGLKFRW